jgi:ABC-type dipeptide/oligopeptide/nickel transport system ATPase component
VLVGPSGCGKSTLLRMIAGLGGDLGRHIEIGGKVVNDMQPKERDIAMVFQNYALYPHMKVRDNMAFSMLLAKRPKREIERARAEGGGDPGLTSSSTAIRASFPAASASAWPWGARSCAIRRCSSSTSRSRTWTPSCASPCARN